MTIQVERCFPGSARFMLTNSNGDREYIRGEEWTRKLAGEALDLYQLPVHRLAANPFHSSEDLSALWR